MKDSPTLPRNRALVGGIVFISIIAFVAGVADILSSSSDRCSLPQKVGGIRSIRA